MRATEIVVVRHGETDWNVARRIQGQLAVDLNARGVAQAEATAVRLSRESFDAIYSSDLSRALDTARAIADGHNLSIVPDVRLREWSLGILEGMLCDEAEVRHPGDYEAFRVEAPDHVIPGGESIRQRYDRSTEAVAEIAKRHSGGRVLIVTHGGVLDDIYRRALELPLDCRKDFRIYNGGINRLTIEEDRWAITGWGEIDHLEGIGSLGEW